MHAISANLLFLLLMILLGILLQELFVAFRKLLCNKSVFVKAFAIAIYWQFLFNELV